jgi:hypothetical protein
VACGGDHSPCDAMGMLITMWPHVDMRQHSVGVYLALHPCRVSAGRCESKAGGNTVKERAVRDFRCGSPLCNATQRVVVTRCFGWCWTLLH